MYHRPVYQIVYARLKEPRRFLQVLTGPRQTGNTTLIRQAMESLNIPGHYASADEPTLQNRAWIEQQWEIGRLLTRGAGTGLAHCWFWTRSRKLAALVTLHHRLAY